jgi:DNA repair exonuclease SbcCD ATPase subunit
MLLVAGSSQSYGQTTDSAHINQLLSDAEHYATMASRDGEEIEAYTRSNLRWESHAHQLESIREHVNHLGKIVQQLNESRDEGSPWQQQAIDEINPVMHEMAAQLSATIDHLSEHQSEVHMKPYRDLARATYEVTNRAAATISDYVEYGKAKSKADALEQKMELPGGGGSE